MILSALAIALQLAAPRDLTSWLPRGPEPVGFSQRWLVDSSRRLPQGQRYGLRHRPVLMNLWYPRARAGGVAMAYGDYFAGAGRAAARTGLDAYAKDLLAYQRDIAWRELAGGTARDSTPPALRARLDALFATSTAAVRDAPRRAGRLPVVVYTQGAGSSYDDNVLLCEYLASRGYLVVGSAYPAEANDRFSTNASDESRQRDIKRLLHEVARVIGEEPRLVAVIGHSAGAQAGFLMAADPSAPIDALLSLDTTEDYSMLSDRSWAYYTDKVVAQRASIRIPIVFAAGPEALFELADSLAASPRTLLTLPGVSHSDYISQGVIRRQAREGLAGDEPAERMMATEAYQSLARYIGDWLDAFNARRGAPTEAPAPLTVRQVAEGTIAPDLATSVPTTAREIRHLFWTQPPAVFVDRVRSARAHDPAIATDGVLMMLLVDAVRRSDTARARSVLDALGAIDGTGAGVLERIEGRAQIFDAIGAKDLAREWRALASALQAPRRP